MKNILCILFIALSCFFAACTPHSVREAEKVVTQADSLWQAGKMYGVDEGDSVSLAQAYETLDQFGKFSIVNYQLSIAYSHACYHYGKLLRTKDNPVEAMQVFIAATHSHTHDYHILGRVYSNMGSICHLAGEYSLSYDMYEKSAHVFLQDGDSLSYYYLLNDMAFELAEQGKKETLTMLDSLMRHCSDIGVIAKTMETKANFFMVTEQYDSALYVLNRIHILGNRESTGYVLKARAYEHLGQIDSALYYAHKVMSLSDASEQNKYNMIYIILNYDSTLRNEDIIALSAQRSDIETDILIPLHNRWAMAVQLLEQDLNREKDWRWLYVNIATIITICLFLLIYIYRKYNQRQLLSQQIEELTASHKEVKQQHEKVIYEYTQYKKNKVYLIEQNVSAIIHSKDFPNNIYWKDYNTMYKMVDGYFGMLVTKLQTIYHLSEREIRLCILVLLGVSNSKQLAQMLYYGTSGIRNFKNRTAKKLNTNSIKLREIIIDIAIGEL